MADDLSVQIAVRMRPFNDRERELGTGKCIVMQGQNVEITDPQSGKVREFAFPYVYDSFDADSPTYASQSVVFNDLGTAYLENAWSGYNCSIFAYGQTGSGKSYSMTGYGEAKGIIPLGLEEMFARIEGNDDENIQFRVEVSYLEIYMEKVRDLFNPKQSVPSLKVRESPKLGIYVEDLKKERVSSYADVERLMELGNQLRTVAHTNMNATSSRSHSVLTVFFTQTRVNKATMQASDMTSKINLIDLAGSERQDKTGASGKRLQEGSAINQSLTALGNVIEALADNATAKKKRKKLVPYRDSKLTRILQESLGGNSKTIMVAAVSPAADNFKESLSTLRYAFRASKIKNTAVINESPNEKVIRELQEEVTKLREMLAHSGINPDEADGSGGEMTEEARREHEEALAELAALKAQLAQQDETIHELAMTKDERVAHITSSLAGKTSQLQSMLMEVHGVNVTMDRTRPHLLNLTDDPQTTERICYTLNDGDTVFGKDKSCDVCLGGVMIKPHHCVVKNEEGRFTIVPSEGATVYLLGAPLKKPAQLQHDDRVVFGNNQFFRFVDPEVLERQQDDEAVVLNVFDYAFAVREMASHNPLAKISGGQGETREQIKERAVLEAELNKMLPLIMEANAIANDLNKARRFEPVFVCDLAQGLSRSRTTTSVRVLHTDDPEATSVWTFERFEEELWDIKDMYSDFVEFGVEMPADDDPFLDPPADRLVGYAHVLLFPLKECMTVGPNLSTPIFDRDGVYQGTLEVSVVPVSPTGEEEPYEDPSYLQPGARFDVSVRIHTIRGISLDYQHGVYCKFKFGEEDFVYTPPTGKLLVDHAFDHEKTLTMPVDDFLIDYIENHNLVIEVWAVVDPSAQMSIEITEVDDHELSATPRFLLDDSTDGGTNDEPNSSEFIADILEQMQPETYAPGQYLIRVGDIGTNMFFLTKGIVILELPNNQGTKQINSGTFFGEIALFMNKPRTASIRAYNDVEVLVLSKTTFDDIVDNHPAIKRQFEELAQIRLDNDGKRTKNSRLAPTWMKEIASIMHGGVSKMLADSHRSSTGAAGASGDGGEGTSGATPADDAAAPAAGDGTAEAEEAPAAAGDA